MSNAIVDRVARALYENAPPYVRADWDDLPPERKSGWLSDARIAVAIVAEEVSRLVEARDPEKPGNYLLRRDHVAPAIRGIPNDLEPDGAPPPTVPVTVPAWTSGRSG